MLVEESISCILWNKISNSTTHTITHK